MKILLKTIKDYVKKELNDDRLSFYLISDTLDLTKTQYLLENDKLIDNEIFDKIKQRLIKLKSGIPLAYVIGNTYFCDYKFSVGPGVLIPRIETEELVYMICDYINELKSQGKSNIKILELCAGSGCIGISLAKKNRDVFVHMIEKDEKAYFYLNKNKNDLSAGNVTLYLDDVLKCYNKFSDDEFDIIVSNPPYIKTSELEKLDLSVKYEPEIALDGGEDGLDFYRNFSSDWILKLKKDGKMFLEIDDDKIKDIFDNVEIKKDLFENTRFAEIKRR